MKKILSIVVITLFVFTSCEKEENSVFDINSISTAATVSGTIYYLGDLSSSIKPYLAASNQTIYVQVIKDGVIKTLTAKTDGNGQYSFEVPTADNYSTSVNFYLSFTAFQKQITGNSKEGLFSGESSEYYLIPNKEYVKNFIITNFQSKDYNPNPTN